MALTRDQAIQQYGTESYTAWDEAGALQDAKAKGIVDAGGNRIGGNTAAPTGSLMTGSAFTPPTQPTINLQQIHDSALNTPEMALANTETATAQKEIDTRQKEYDDSVAMINDNPFYSVAKMTGKEAKLTNKFEADKQRILNRKAQAENKVAQMKADAQIKVNIATSQYNINSQNYQNTLSQFNSLLSAGGFTNSSGAEIAQYAVATGIPVAVINNIVAKQKQEEVKPHVITSEDENGNVTVSILDLNNPSNPILSKSSLGQVGSGRADNETKLTESELKAQYYEDAKIAARGGKTLQSMIQFFQGRLSPDEIYQIYNANSIKGQGGYGPATESPKELGQFGIKVNMGI